MISSTLPECDVLLFFLFYCTLSFIFLMEITAHDSNIQTPENKVHVQMLSLNQDGKNGMCVFLFNIKTLLRYSSNFI